MGRPSNIDFQTYSAASSPNIHHEASRRLEDNFDGRVINPIAHYSDEQLADDVDHFVHQHLLLISPQQSIRNPEALAKIALFQKAAKLARNPQSVNAHPDLTDHDKAVLQQEKNYSYRQPWKLYLTLLTCSFAALTQGWSQTGMNGANIAWTEPLGLGTKGPRHDWLLGLVNAAVYLAAALIGCVFVDPLNDYFKLGRRGTIFVSAIFSLIAPFGSAVSQTWYQLLATRFLLGIGMGLKASTVPIFAAEISPTKIRGSVVLFWQLWDACGILFGYCANLIVLRSGIAWRLQAGSSFIPAIPVLFLIYLCPESPRWYIKHDQLLSAFESVVALRGNELLAARDVYLLYKQIEIEDHYLARYKRQVSPHDPEKTTIVAQKSTYFRRLMEIVTLGRMRRATIASFTVMLAQQLCGINIVSFYGSNFFLSVTASNKDKISYDDSKKALLFAFGTGLCNFLFTFPAIRSIDKFGRRKLLLYTFPNMAWLLLAIGFSYESARSSRLPLVAFFTLVYVAFYSLGGGPVPFTYSAEAFPLSHREIGMGAAVAVNLFFAGLLALLYPRMNSALGSAASLGIFCALCMVAWFMIYMLVPETAQCSLEDLDFRFGVPTKRHVRHQNQTVEWYLKPKHRRGAKPSLYVMDTDSDAASSFDGIGVPAATAGNAHGGLGVIHRDGLDSDDDVSNRGSIVNMPYAEPSYPYGYSHNQAPPSPHSYPRKPVNNHNQTYNHPNHSHPHAHAHAHAHAHDRDDEASLSDDDVSAASIHAATVTTTTEADEHHSTTDTTSQAGQTGGAGQHRSDSARSRSRWYIRPGEIGASRGLQV